MKLNKEQRKYLADIWKIIAAAQFSVIGYSGFMKVIASSFVGSSRAFALLVFYGVYVLKGATDE